MIAGYINQITALARLRGVGIRKLRLAPVNSCTKGGSMPKRTMVGGAMPVELQVEIDCNLDEAALNGLLMNAVHASPLNGLVRGRLESLFTLTKNRRLIPDGKALPVESPVPAGPGVRFDVARS